MTESEKIVSSLVAADRATIIRLGGESDDTACNHLSFPQP